MLSHQSVAHSSLPFNGWLLWKSTIFCSFGDRVFADAGLDQLPYTQDMGLYLRLAWRNIWRNRRRSLIALIAMALGLALLILMDGFIAGSKQAVFGNAVKLQGGNIQVHAPGYRERAQRLPLLPLSDADAVLAASLTRPEIVAASRRIRTSGMVSTRAGSFPIAILGIEPEREAPVGLLAKNMRQGQYLTAGAQDDILIGRALADHLKAGVGDRITLMGRAANDQTRGRAMTVVGIYDLGLGEIEKRMVYISLVEAQTLFNLRGQATEVVIALHNVGQESTTLAALRAALPDYEVDAWLDLNPDMRQTYAVNEQFMVIFGLVLLLVAGIGILNVLLMAIFERTRELGVLAAMGLKQRNILMLFLLEGALLGLLGALIGCAMGGLAVGYVGQVGFDLAGFSEASQVTALMGERLHPYVGLDLLLTRVLTVELIAIAASFYPAWRASRHEPSEALHYV